jgi:hypothetical protein
MPYGGIPAVGIPSAGKLAEVVLSAGVPAECMTVHAIRSNQKMVYCSWKRKLYLHVSEDEVSKHCTKYFRNFNMCKLTFDFITINAIKFDVIIMYEWQI